MYKKAFIQNTKKKKKLKNIIYKAYKKIPKKLYFYNIIIITLHPTTYPLLTIVVFKGQFSQKNSGIKFQAKTEVTRLFTSL